MSNIRFIELGNLSHEEYIKLISYIEKAGNVPLSKASHPIYNISSIEGVKGNPPRYSDIKIGVSITDREDSKQNIRESLKGLIDILEE